MCQQIVRRFSSRMFFLCHFVLSVKKKKQEPLSVTSVTVCSRPPFLLLLLPTHRLLTFKSSEDTCLTAEHHEATRPADNLHRAAADVDAARLLSPGTRLGAAGAGVRAAAQPARGRVQLEERLLPLVQSRFHHPGHRPAGNVSPHVLLTKEDAGAMK